MQDSRAKKLIGVQILKFMFAVLFLTFLATAVISTYGFVKSSVGVLYALLAPSFIVLMCFIGLIIMHKLFRR